jgi:hypothetical protein
MRILCRHGHFAFYPNTVSDIARFCKYFDTLLIREQDYYTYAGLLNAPSYSLTGKPYLNIPAVETFEGKPWEVMKQNGFVFHLGLKVLVPKVTIVNLVDLSLVGYYFVAGGALVQPGSRMATGGQILSYSSEFVQEGYPLRISEYTYE